MCFTRLLSNGPAILIFVSDAIVRNLLVDCNIEMESPPLIDYDNRILSNGPVILIFVSDVIVRNLLVDCNGEMESPPLRMAFYILNFFFNS